MKATKILIVILSLTTLSLSNDLMLYKNDGQPGSAFCFACASVNEPTCVPQEEIIGEFIKKYICIPGKTVRKKITLENIKIELERVVTNFRYVHENHRTTSILKNKMNNNFLNDINKTTLDFGDIIVVFCYEINIYNNNNLITTFKTNGNHFYDITNKLMYYSEKDLLLKYWGILEENSCQ